MEFVDVHPGTLGPGLVVLADGDDTTGVSDDLDESRDGAGGGDPDGGVAGVEDGVVGGARARPDADAEWVLAQAVRAWRAAPGTSLGSHVDRGLALLRELVGG